MIYVYYSYFKKNMNASKASEHLLVVVENVENVDCSSLTIFFFKKVIMEFNRVLQRLVVKKGQKYNIVGEVIRITAEYRSILH